MRLQIADCRFLTERRPQFAIANQKSNINNQKFPLTVEAQPLAGGQLQNVDDFSGEQIGDDIVDGSEEKVCTSSTVQNVTLARVVQHIYLRFQ